MTTRLRLFIRSLFRRRQFERAMSDELRFHIDAFTDDLVRSGVPRDEARRRARAEFGGVESVKEDCRQARGLRLADELRQDLRYAVRTMARAPVVMAAVVVSLALGIGANTALFGFVDAVFLRTLPVRSPHELFYLAHHAGPQRDADSLSTSSNYPLYVHYGEQDVFAGLTAYQAGAFNVAAADGVEPVTGQVVSGNYHAVVGAPIVLGRGFSSEPDRDVSRGSIAVISDTYWARAFGRSAGAVGSTITVNGRPIEIVGVTAPGFYGFDSESRADITLPLAVVGLDNPDFFDDHGSWMGLRLVGRLKPGVTETQALAATDIAFQQFMREPEQQWVLQSPNADGFRRAALLSAARGSDGRRELTEKPIRLLVAMAGILLLIACANVANLLLVRGAARRREVAVRAGIGAGRARLIRQFATEGMLVALCGGLLGLPVAAWTSAAILSVLDAGPTPFLLDVTLDVRALAFTLVVSAITGIGFALLPAFRSTADVRALAPALRSDAGTYRGRVDTGGLVLVASQIALCVLLLVGTGLLSRSLFNLKTLDAGFDRTQVLLADVSTRGAGFTPDRRMSLYDSLLERVRLLPGVVSASAATRTPIDLSSRNNRIVVPGADVQGFQAVSPNVVSPEFFRALGIGLVRGRMFTRDDRTGQPRVAVVSEGMARFYFGDAEPLGRTIMLGSDEPMTIVGVVADVRHERLTAPATPKMVYTPLAQTGGVGPFGDNAVPERITLVTQVAADRRAIGAAVRAEVRRLDRAAMVSYVRTMDAQVDAALVRERLLAVLSSGISVLALLLACVGLYGTLSYTVVRRTREIGIRMALGAARVALIGRILRQCLTMVACGIIVGGLASLWASRALSAFLFGLSPRDPATMTAAIAVLLVTACLAGYIPARRAASVDPARVLRIE